MRDGITESAAKARQLLGLRLSASPECSKSKLQARDASERGLGFNPALVCG